MTEIDLYDPIAGRRDDWWYPANRETRELHAVLHAGKQVLKLAAALDKTAPSNDAHGLTLLAAPVLTLIEHAIALRKLLGRADRSCWTSNDRDRFRDCARKLGTMSGGKLRTLRNCFGAHAETELSSVDGASLATADVLLPPLGNGLILAILTLNHEGVFHWTRTPSGRTSFEIIGQVKTPEGHHPPIAVEISKLPDGTMALHGLRFVDDPREFARTTLLDCVRLYNVLAGAATPPQPTMWIREYEGPKRRT